MPETVDLRQPNRTALTILTVLLAVVLTARTEQVWAQTCSLTLSGVVSDQYTGGALSYATIFLEEQATGTTTDSAGVFIIPGLCPGSVHIRITHLGCEPERVYLNLSADTFISVRLRHHEEFLELVTVRTESIGRTAIEVRHTLPKESLDREAGRPLAEVLESVSGVSVLKSGGGIAKPVIHGLYGNRLMLLNNGLIQAGQQWGNDHAPEIDPLAADRLTVIKGVATLEYGTGNLGGAILAEPGPPSNDPHLHGSVNYAFQSNGLGHTLSGRMEQSALPWSWRITGTLKGIGDLRAPSYFLTNTGSREANFSARLRRDWSTSLSTTAYYSRFTTSLGILRGAHIGNLSDLTAAIDREVPFFTEETFSRQLKAPRQTVSHQLWKIQLDYLLDEHRAIRVTYGGQLNQRQEFDVRRSGRTDIPALSLQLNSQQVQATYTASNTRGDRIKAGLQLRSDGNRNDPVTGILPLLPDYIRYQGGLFVTLRRQLDRWAWELGGRYDLINYRVAAISNSVPKTIIRYRHLFHNIATSVGLRYDNTTGWVTKLNIGLVSRAPEVNELHSAGLHQGVAGIEEGNPELRPEASLKAVWSNQFTPSANFLVEATAYAQHISNYIFLEPQDEFRLTIRGAFPVFLYRQTDAIIAGADMMVKWEPSDNWALMGNFALVRGQDQSRQIPLVFIPADNLTASLRRHLPDFGPFRHFQLGLSGRYVFKQKRYEPGQDFLPPPASYWLLGLNLESRIHIESTEFRLSLQVDNLLNRRYREYLNRLRYYADEAGRNIRLGLRWAF